MMKPEDVADAICESLGATRIKHLGKGAFKHTFLIEADGEHVALKVLNAGFDVQRLDREVDAMVRCSHPNIARLLSVDRIVIASETRLYFIEEYLDGGSLRDRLDEGGLLSADEVRDVVRELNSAAQRLFAENLVHRDIKPENVMFRLGENVPVLVDFGIVRDLAADSLTASFALQGPGTPLYAAPEQLRNEKCMIDWRTDQFSIGVTASYAAFGRHPYQREGDSPTAIVQRVIGRDGPVDDFATRCEQAGLSQLAKMVQPWPVRRFRTATELISAWV